MMSAPVMSPRAQVIQIAAASARGAKPPSTRLVTPTVAATAAPGTTAAENAKM